MHVLLQPLSLNPLKQMAKVNEVDYSADFDNFYSKMDDFDKFFKTGKVSDMLRYILGLAKVGYQGQLHSTETKKKYTDDTYKNKKMIEFNVQLTKGHCTNFQTVHLCFSLKFKVAADNDNNIAAGLIIVNNYFAHWIKEIDIKRYGRDIPILPRTNMVNIYQYSDEILKHMPKDAFKTIQNDLLHSNKKVVIPGNNANGRAHHTTAANAANRTDENLTNGIAKFHDQLKSEYVYRIPLKFLCDLGLVNQCFKFNTKYILTLETEMQRLSESPVVGFTGANNQFSFFAISLVYDKSDQHRSIYGSYNAELASTKNNS